ncbi:phosphoglucomutase, alpha-D-glucose phosphate-specific [Planctomycetales bacterium]|nr:phosphoglucomutase, alpha-D-glucose phosphate-specific [Planctomycetales bacterium]GHT36177.1 phosphoglucomutase, alpha-D-glucose phosphate-specific [Planctomycetales bacterium]
MPIHPLAGKPAPKEILVNLGELEKKYYETKPDVNNPAQLVSFGTSGHRGTSLDGSFTESHILAICQAICDYRKMKGYTHYLYLGMDTHFLSKFAQKTALEVFDANGVHLMYQENDEFTPTPVISWWILRANNPVWKAPIDGVIITPSHNPPSDGGIKYNPPNGGPADADVTSWIQDKANEYLKSYPNGCRIISKEYNAAQLKIDFAEDYIADLKNIVDMEAIRKAKIRIGVDPLGGAGVHYWEPIAEKYGLDITVVNKSVDPQFGFMCVDHDGKIRMDCSSPYAMHGLVAMKDKFDIAFANDPDTDRHGIVVPSVGLMNPNHYLAVAIQYLFTHRPNWSKSLGIGKTLVSSGIIDKVAADLGRKLVEVPVGFKWFVDGLYNGTLGFGGEESAGASFLRFDGTVWSTDKDGIILNLLAAEILAKTGKDPGVLYQEIEAKFGKSFYTRVDQPTTPEGKAAFKNLTVSRVACNTLAGDEITAKLTNAPGNGAPIGGLKVVSTHGWFAARPSGTENIYKIYAESFKSEEHLQQILNEAKDIVDAALN